MGVKWKLAAPQGGAGGKGLTGKPTLCQSLAGFVENREGSRLQRLRQPEAHRRGVGVRSELDRGEGRRMEAPSRPRRWSAQAHSLRVPFRLGASIPDPLPQRQCLRLSSSRFSSSSASFAPSASADAAPGARAEPRATRCHASPAAALKDGNARPSALPAAPAAAAAAALRPHPRRGPARCRRRPPG